jgi:chromosome segregation ATPase
MRVTGIVIALMAVLAACNSTDEEYAKLQKEHQALKQQMALKDSLVDNFIRSLSAIEENLLLVRSKQRLIEDHTRHGAELSGDVRQRIIAEIGTIDEMLAGNKERIDAFREELRRSNIRIDAFRETINTLNGVLQVREDQMDTLKMQLVAMNLKADELEQLIGGLQEEGQQKDSIIDQKIRLMNEGYVAIAETKDLLERGVVEKQGGILGIGSTLTLSKTLDMKTLNKIDVTEAGGFSFNAKKARLVTSHPEHSYELQEREDFYSLVIEDLESFWSQSKLLVIATKE